MGYYIQVPENHNKANQLVALHEAKLIDKPAAFSAVSPDLAIICVVDNGLFEAAGFAYSDDEFRAFAHGLNGRRAWWLTMPRSDAERLSGFRR